MLFRSKEGKLLVEEVSNEDKLESIKAFQSTIRKSENALANMTQKGQIKEMLQSFIHRFGHARICLETKSS